MVNRNQIIGGVIILAVFLLVATQTSIFKQTIIGAGQITYDDNTQEYFVTLLVNDTEKLWTIPSTSMSNENVITTKSLEIQYFQITRPSCFYSLNQRSAGTFTYFDLGQPLLETEIAVNIKELPSGTTFNSGSIPIGFGNPIITTIDSDGVGTITIEGLGQINQGLNCPEATAGVLVPTSSGDFKLVDRFQFGLLIDTQQDCDLTFTGILNCSQALIDIIFNNAENLPEPSAWDRTIDIVPLLSQGRLLATLPNASISPLFQLRFDREFVEGIIVERRDGVPNILSVRLDDSTIDNGESTILRVDVRNDGETFDTFQIIPSAGFARFSPVEHRLELNPGENAIAVFQVTGTSIASGNITVSAIGTQSGRSDSDTINLTVEQGITVRCGDGVCSFLEFCPADCDTPQHLACVNLTCTLVDGSGENTCLNVGDTCDVPPIVCEFWETKDIAESGFLIDFFGIKLFPTTSTETCQTDFVGIFIVLLGVTAIVFVARMKVK